MEREIRQGTEVPGDELQVFLKALASGTRQRLLQHFSDGGELTVGEVAERSGLGPSTASEHLAVLRRGGLLRSSRDGKAVRYRTDTAGITELLSQLQAYLLQHPEGQRPQEQRPEGQGPRDRHPQAQRPQEQHPEGQEEPRDRPPER
ncbi:ArsR/SmtB family transcription factor [Streptomyces palmae]|uniref:ArsR/SmtB family transcription factor n=1 Tax=Streptomyces palmae TaxID=1701085 RepID=UPI001FD81BD0|nr:metalloregulator ArsR/SmtB family transcription factor [Streptomyces palmae]